MLRVCLLWSLRYRLLRTLRLRISLYRCLCVYWLLGVWLLLLYRRFRLCLLFHQVEEASPVHFRVGCLYLLLDFLQLGGIRVCFRLCKHADGFPMVPGGCQFFRLLHQFLVLLPFLAFFLRLLGFRFLGGLAAGGGLVRLCLKLCHVGDQPARFLYRSCDCLQESCVKFLRCARDSQRHDVVLGLVLESVRFGQCGNGQLSVCLADDDREVHAFRHHLVDCCKKHNFRY